MFYWVIKMEDKSSRKYGYKLGLRDGFNEGIKQGKKICAYRMRKLNVSKSIIRKVTRTGKQKTSNNW